MSEREPIESTDIDRYGSPPPEWPVVREQLSARRGPEGVFYLSTVGADGNPHTVGMGPVWYHGDFYLAAGKQTRKMRDLAANPHATLATRLEDYDVTMDGTVTLVSDPAMLEAVATVYRDGGWPAHVEGDALTAPFSAQTAGPPPWHLYRFRFTKAIALRIGEPGGAARWRFAD